MIKAAIDLGTNTFHFLVADVSHSPFQVVDRGSVFVKLAEEGIARIGDAPFSRGLETLRQFKEQIDQYPVETVTAMGTAALRTASNGSEFIAAVAAETNLQIQVIGGDEEARLIYQGVRASGALDSKSRSLIMDIGGGSVEFIIADANTLYWKQSFPIGITVLFHGFQHTDPITTQDISAIHTYLHTELKPLWLALEQYPCHSLTGASGTFDVLAHFLGNNPAHSLFVDVPVSSVKPFSETIWQQSRNELRNMEGMPETRADLIGVALVLVNHILEVGGVKDLRVSSYAMLEGILTGKD